MTTKRRQRELARAKEERRQARRASEQARKSRRQKLVIYSLVIVLVIGATGGGLLVALSNNNDDSATADEGTTNLAQPVSICAQPGELSASDVQYEAPEQVISDGEQIALTLNTNCGPISIETNSQAAPETVNSMTFLAENNFFDRTACHRLVVDGIFVLQCGDPTATGAGGPGYQIPDENLPTEEGVNYPAGTVAMANSGPDTNGSQFFLVYQDTTLPPSYTIWGTITQGLDLVEAIAAAGTAEGTPDGAPRQSTVIDTVDVQRG